MANESNGDPHPTFHDFLSSADELTQVSIAIYDRLLHIRNNLGGITNRGDQRQHPPQSSSSALTSMHPEHSAVVLSSRDNTIPDSSIMFANHMRERLGEQTRLVATTARQMDTTHARSLVAPGEQSGLPGRDSPQSSASLGELTNNAHYFSHALSVRRTMLEATLRQLRRSSDPNDPSTSLGRRVMTRATTSAAVMPPTRSDTTVHSMLPSGFDHRQTRSLEPRAAAHLRHSLLPNPPPSVRPSVPRMLHNGRLSEYRPRIMRNHPATSQNVVVASSEDESSRTRQLYSESLLGSYRVRRRLNGRGQEHTTNTGNWNDLSNPVRDLPAPDPWTWAEPSWNSPEFQRTVNNENGSAQPSHVGNSSNVHRRRRGWARLDPDGDEVSTEDEEEFERTRSAEARSPNSRIWRAPEQSLYSANSATASDSAQQLDSGPDPTKGESLSSAMNSDPLVCLLDSVFNRSDADISHKCPLPVPLVPERMLVNRHAHEVRITINVDAGR